MALVGLLGPGAEFGGPVCSKGLWVEQPMVDVGGAEAESVSGPLRCPLGWVWEWAWPPLAWTPRCHASGVAQGLELSVRLTVEIVKRGLDQLGGVSLSPSQLAWGWAIKRC